MCLLFVESDLGETGNGCVCRYYNVLDPVQWGYKTESVIA